MIGKTKPFALFFDNVNNITVWGSYAILEEQDDNSEDLIQIKISDFEGFLKKHPKKKWHPPGFTAMLAVLQYLGYEGPWQEILDENNKAFRNSSKKIESIVQQLAIK